MTDTRLAIGLDIGGTKIAGAVVDEHGTVVAEHVEPTPAESSGEAVTEVLLSMIDRFRAHHDVATIGVGAAGIVEWPVGVMLWAPNNAYRDWPVREQLLQTASRHSARGGTPQRQAVFLNYAGRRLTQRAVQA